MSRSKEIFKKKGKNIEQHVLVFNKNIEAEINKLKKVKTDILPLIEIIEKSGYKERYSTLRFMLEKAEVEFNGKEDLGEYFLNFKVHVQNSFSDA